MSEELNKLMSSGYWSKSYQGKSIIKAVDDISFRLLGTRKHKDYIWMMKRLSDLSGDVVDSHVEYISNLPDYEED